MSKLCLNCGRANHAKAALCKRCNQALSLLVILSVLIVAVSLFTLGYVL